jgi:Antibiotic biosynthesis monooxygenase
MAIAVYFHPKSMSLSEFEEAHKRLVEAGADAPEGRIHHSCFGEDENLMVYDIWESPEAFDAFGQTLMPILAEIDVDPGEPSIMELHRLEQIAMTATPTSSAQG